MGNELRLLIVTGMSGAGKTQVLQFLEDMGYFCVDNLPPVLIPKFAELCRDGGAKVHHVALVVDIRGGEFFDALSEALEQMGDQQIDYEIMFLEAENEVLIRRYKETRRAHPLAPQERVLQGIRKEREMLAGLKRQARHVVDTSSMKPSALREFLQKEFAVNLPVDGFSISFVSFGFKYGTPLDLDIMFDVRFLPNPYYIEEYRHATGRVPKVAEYIAEQEVTQEFMGHLQGLLDFLIPHYEQEGKQQLVIGVGCTGGMHRSVWVAETLTAHVAAQGWQVGTEHRDLYKNEVEEDFVAEEENA